jgi:hypothetical protein
MYVRFLRAEENPNLSQGMKMMKRKEVKNITREYFSA